jgi:stage V sporulation protein AD
MSKLGRQTYDFTQNPVYVAGTGTVAGQVESDGPLGQCFDVRHANDRIDGDTWEHSEQRMFGQAAQIAMQKANLTSEQIDVLIGGDLNAQLTGFYFGLRPFPAPSLGVYSACASICEALTIGSVLVSTGYAENALVGTSSHTSTAERQFRYPTEYGAQKPPTAQRTVTGAGMALLTNTRKQIEVTHATVGRVVNYGVTSPWEMGAAMAPAAVDTLLCHMRDTNRTFADYDCIATGDLGDIGHTLLKELLKEKGISELNQLTDCGMLVYDKITTRGIFWRQWWRLLHHRHIWPFTWKTLGWAVETDIGQCDRCAFIHGQRATA